MSWNALPSKPRESNYLPVQSIYLVKGCKQKAMAQSAFLFNQFYQVHADV
jgi:hypothetical protein